MDNRLAFAALVLWAFVLPTFAEDYSKGLRKRGLWWGSDKKKSGPKANDISREYSILTCPLDFLSKKKCDKRGLLPYAPYGLKHTFIKISTTCYDWGDWNYARHASCTGSQMYCCYEDSTRSYRSYTKCANRIGEFEDAWENKVGSYTLWTWNCQKYTNAMKDFLNNCYSRAADAVP